jgi:DNA uptake protein ComE-like DNA-binding protein
LKFESRETDSLIKTAVHDRYQNQKKIVTVGNADSPSSFIHSELFYFDPNGLNISEWRRLGLPDRLIHTIQHYIEKGGRFRKPEDLKKLYGLRNSDYHRLLPYVRITNSPGNFQTGPGNYTKTSNNIQTVKNDDSFSSLSRLNSGRDFVHTVKKFIVTDINFADSADWLRLPGIGEKLASRIVHFREKLGGFYQLDQVGETFGLPDSSFQKIKPFLRMNSVSLNKIDLNSATKEILQSHPYIRWQLSKAILEYREQHGGFHSVDELLQLAQVDTGKFERLKPYLVAEVK